VEGRVNAELADANQTKGGALGYVGERQGRANAERNARDQESGYLAARLGH
jgi:hypothetical protein